MSRRYTILRHEGVDQPHFDLLFEVTPIDLLAAWRSEAWPITSSQPVTRLPDHRRIYLDYQGPISGGRGEVRQVTTGECAVGIHPDHWSIYLLPDGPELCFQPADGEDEACWTVAPITEQ